MAPRSVYMFLSILVVAIPISAAALGPRVGGWKPIKDPNDAEVVMVAKFAVEEHNKKASTSLVFEKVVKGESQVVAGTNYRLDISVAGGGAASPKSYRAVVYYRPWQKYLELISFEEING